MKLNRIKALIIGVVLFMAALPVVGRAEEDPRPAMVGGYSDTAVSDARVMGAAKFAVQAEQKAMKKNKGRQTKLVLVKILSAKQQVVAGMNYQLTLEVKANKAKKQAEAVVYQDLSGAYSLTSWAWK